MKTVVVAVIYVALMMHMMVALVSHAPVLVEQWPFEELIFVLVSI